MLNFKQKKEILILVAIFPLLLILALFLNMSHQQNQLKTNVFHREYKGDLIKFSRTFKAIENTGGIKYFHGKLYLNDYQNRQIIEMDSLGNTLNIYHENIEESIQSMIIGWDVDERGIYLADARRHVITHLGFDNSVIYQYNPGQYIHRAGRLKADQFLITTPDLEDPKKRKKLLLMLVDAKDQSKLWLDYPLPDVEDSRMKLTGFYMKGESGQMFYICYMTGLFFSMNDQGEFLYLKNTVDRSPYPKVLVDAAKSRRFDPLSPTVNQSAGADNNYLYILSKIVSSDDDVSGSSVIDVYKIEDGQYVWSFKVPDRKGEKVKNIALAPNGFYFHQGDEITYYTNVRNIAFRQ